MKKKLRKCCECKKKITKFQNKCSECNHYIHKQCLPKNHNDGKSICTTCLFNHLSLSQVSNHEFHQFFKEKTDFENIPGFKIQSLIDDLKKNQNEDNSFISDSIKSKYFTPSEFMEYKFDKSTFSILHVNVASLAKHINDLKSLLAGLNHDFDVISVTETKFKDVSSNLINVDTPTKSDFGGCLIYAKSVFSCKLLPEFSISVKGIFESTFVEIKNNNKSLIVGTMYRHPTSNTSFIENFLHPTLDKLNKTNKKVIFTGDFNYDLIKYESHKQTNDFYDLVSSYSYRPFILQPSRITYKSNTLIDNIFANDLACNSDGGNITSTIADHFIQFSFCDIFGKSKKR